MHHTEVNGLRILVSLASAFTHFCEKSLRIVALDGTNLANSTSKNGVSLYSPYYVWVLILHVCALFVMKIERITQVRQTERLKKK